MLVKHVSIYIFFNTHYIYLLTNYYNNMNIISITKILFIYLFIKIINNDNNYN